MNNNNGLTSFSSVGVGRFEKSDPAQQKNMGRIRNTAQGGDILYFDIIVHEKKQIKTVYGQMGLHTTIDLQSKGTCRVTTYMPKRQNTGQYS